MQKERARERIIMFLCFISLLLTPVLATSQSTAMRVSLNLKSATVKEFFDAVKVQTGLNFIYNTEQVKNMPHITVRSSSQPVNEVLDKVLANTGYTYEIVSDSVFKAVSDTQTPQGILCLVRKPQYRLEELLNAGKIIRPAYIYVGQHTEFHDRNDRN